jgi:hypothetical protein
MKHGVKGNIGELWHLHSALQMVKVDLALKLKKKRLEMAWIPMT